jgi:hypothetical protein
MSSCRPRFWGSVTFGIIVAVLPDSTNEPAVSLVVSRVFLEVGLGDKYL